MAGRRYPLSLAPVRALLPAKMAENAVLALGPGATAARGLVDAGLFPPDVLAAMTLFLLAGQPRREPSSQPEQREQEGDQKEKKEVGEGRGVAGSVWVREHFTLHRPVRLGEEVEVTGAIQSAYARRGRRYSVTSSETRDASGVLLVSSCTTGLVRYRRDPGLADSSEGLGEDEIRRPAPDPSAADENPALDVLRGLRSDDDLHGPASLVSLDQMRVRDGGQSRNPIHTDPEAARQAGLAVPIAGGSHVFGYVQEALMQALGTQALLYGACFDLRWLSQVRAGSRVEPSARVSSVAGSRVDLDLEVACERRTAMTGSLQVPLPAP